MTPRMRSYFHVSNMIGVTPLLAGFLDQKGICLSPSFYMPENEDLRWGTHNGIRKTLFFSIFRDIKFAEFRRLKN